MAQKVLSNINPPKLSYLDVFWLPTLAGLGPSAIEYAHMTVEWRRNTRGEYPFVLTYPATIYSADLY